MDTISHFLLSYFLFGGSVNILWIILFSNLPDLLSMPFKIYFLGKKTNFKNFPKSLFTWEPSDNYLKFYRTFHSFLFITLLGLILSFFTKNYLILAGCMASHIFLDIFSHTSKWATRPLYPFSDIHFKAFNWFEGGRSLKLYFLISLSVIFANILKILI
jgi:hypothetical protein